MINMNWLKSRKGQRWIFGILLALVVLGLRVPWINSDIGSPSLWTYGYFLTDEGYYTSGGRLAYLTGDFIAPELGESFTFYNFPVLNVLSFFSYKIFGLTTWAHRVPTMLGALVCWLIMFNITARRTVPWIAFVVTLLISCNPFSLAYERTASSDVMMAAFLVPAYFFLLKGKLSYLFFAGALFAIAQITKPSAMAFTPLFFITLISARDRRVVRLLCWGGMVILTYQLLRGGMELYVANVAEGLGYTKDQLVGIISRTAKAPSQSLKNLPVYMRVWSSLPRWPEAGKVAFFLVWGLAIPTVVVTRRLFTNPLKWSKGSQVSLGVMAYILMIGVHVFFNVRYLLPMIYFIPLMVVLARRELTCNSAEAAPLMKWLAVSAGAMGVFILLFAIWPFGAGFETESLKGFFYTQYLRPKQNIWLLTWPFIVVSALVIAGTACFIFRRNLDLRAMLIGIISLLVAGHLGATAAPLFCERIVPKVPDWKIWVASFQAMALLYVLVMWLRPRLLRTYKGWYGLFVCLFVGILLFDPVWKKGMSESVKRNTYLRDTSLLLQKQLPDNAVFLGERALSMFVSSSMDLASTAMMKEEAIVELAVALVKSDPSRPVFAILDPVERQLLTALQKNKDKIKIKMVGKVPLPGFGSPGLMEVYICQISLP